MDVIACSTGAEGLDVLERKRWEICLLDRGLPDFDGIEICRRIKADARFDTRRVIMVSGYDSLDARLEALNLGADDYITKPFHPAEVLARVNASRRAVEMQQQLLEMAQQLEELSEHDHMTGIFNRRRFTTALDRAFEHSNRYGRPLSVALIDIDGFKRINDSYGHPAGDAVLVEVARRFSGTVRATDFLARYGGDEFVVLLPETQLHDALSFGEKLRSVVVATPVPVADGAPLPVTISVGTASLAHTQFNSTAEMIAAADQALYRAKRNGRNRVEGERRRAPRARTAERPQAQV